MDSVQQQIYYNGNVFGNKCCRCNAGSLYLAIQNVRLLIVMLAELMFRVPETESDGPPENVNYKAMMYTLR